MKITNYKISYEAKSWHTGIREDCEDALHKVYQAILALQQCDSITVLSADVGDTVNIHPSMGTIYVQYVYDASIDSKHETPLSDILEGMKHSNPEMTYRLEEYV